MAATVGRAARISGARNGNAFGHAAKNLGPLLKLCSDGRARERLPFLDGSDRNSKVIPGPRDELNASFWHLGRLPERFQ